MGKTSTTKHKGWKVMKFNQIIGAKKEIETPYVRVEVANNTLRGHPTYRDGIRKIIEDRKLRTFHKL
jgi:hypothetical protein